MLFLRKDEILVRIAAKQFHSATTCFLSTNYNIMLASQLQLQEWDLQDITKEERGRGPICASGEEFEDESNYTFTYYYSYHSLFTEVGEGQHHALYIPMGEVLHHLLQLCSLHSS